MNHHTRTTGMLAVLLAVPALAIGVMTPAGAAPDKKPDSVCHIATQYLPRTPDAVEGWLRHCSTITPQYLPWTPDAVEGWLRHRSR